MLHFANFVLPGSQLVWVRDFISFLIDILVFLFSEHYVLQYSILVTNLFPCVRRDRQRLNQRARTLAERKAAVLRREENSRREEDLRRDDLIRHVESRDNLQLTYLENSIKRVDSVLDELRPRSALTTSMRFCDVSSYQYLVCIGCISIFYILVN